MHTAGHLSTCNNVSASQKTALTTYPDEMPICVNNVQHAKQYPCIKLYRGTMVPLQGQLHPVSRADLCLVWPHVAVSQSTRRHLSPYHLSHPLQAYHTAADRQIPYAFRKALMVPPQTDGGTLALTASHPLAIPLAVLSPGGLVPRASASLHLCCLSTQGIFLIMQVKLQPSGCISLHGEAQPAS